MTCRFAAAAAAFFSILPPASAAGISVGTGSLRLNTQVASIKDLRDRNLVKQQFDYSCGATALATLLSEQLADPVSEAEVIEQLVEMLKEDETRQLEKTGFSLLDLKRVAERRGHRAAGFRLALEQLARIDRAVIVFLRLEDGPHFTVLRGIRGDRAFLSDSNLGNVRWPIKRFQEYWRGADGMGIIFVVERGDGGADLEWRHLPGQDYEPPEKMSARELLDIASALPKEQRR